MNKFTIIWKVLKIIYIYENLSKSSNSGLYAELWSSLALFFVELSLDTRAKK